MPILNWIGKDKVINHDKELPFRVLKSIRELSVGKENKNLLIEGDNLEALKTLMPIYYNQVKCIYIDPPYNTGAPNQQWVYNDNVDSSQIKAWLKKVVGPEGKDLCRHDKWLCMMYPRLKLLRDLLRDDGLIFISIDDNEVNSLKAIMDEIFIGNFIAQLPTIMNLKGNNDEFGFAGTHEYTLVYAKNKKFANIGFFQVEDEELDKWIKDDIGFYRKGANLKATGTNAPRSARPNLFFPIYIRKNNTISITRKSSTDIKLLPITDGKEMSWRWEKKKIDKDNNEIIIIRNKDGISLYKKQRPTLGDLPSKKPKSVFYKPKYSSGNGTAQLKKIFKSKVFNNPKPIDLIKDLIFIATNKNTNDIVLDSFAGSGTTGHSVLELNKADGGNRNFILIELENKIAKKITSKRLNKAINGYVGSNYPEGTGQSFTYLALNGELYNSSGFINHDAKYEDLAGYIYFSETRNYLNLTTIKNPYIGSFESNHYFLFYGRRNKNILDDKSVKKLNSRKGIKVIYADKCLLDEEYLETNKIIFKQIPYELKKY